jgi:hypothetical protein
VREDFFVIGVFTGQPAFCSITTLYGGFAVSCLFFAGGSFEVVVDLAVTIVIQTIAFLCGGDEFPLAVAPFCTIIATSLLSGLTNPHTFGSNVSAVTIALSFWFAEAAFL